MENNSIAVKRNQVVVGYQLVQGPTLIRDFMLLELLLLCLCRPSLLNFIFKVGGGLLDTYIA